MNYFIEPVIQNLLLFRIIILIRYFRKNEFFSFDEYIKEINVKLKGEIII